MELDAFFAVLTQLKITIQKLGGMPDLEFSTDQWHGRSSTLIVTDDCNLRCTYCYCTKTPRIMPWSVAKDYIDYLFESHLHLADIPKEAQEEIDHRKIFEFIGGEPLLQFPLMRQCMEYIHDRVQTLADNHPWKRTDWPCTCNTKHPVPGIRFMISTNGLLLNDPEIQEFFLPWKDYVYLGVTLDGTKEMHDLCRKTPDGEGSYDKVMGAWRWMLRHYQPCTRSTKSTIAHENIDYICDIVKFFYNLGLENLAQNCVFENVWHRGDQHKLLKQLIKVADFLLEKDRYKKFKVRWFSSSYFETSQAEGKWCGAGTYMDCCDAEGIIYPCLRFKELKQRAPLKLGDVLTGKNKELLDQFTSTAENAIYDPQQPFISGLKHCATCPTSALCADCQAYAYDCFGSLKAKSPFICPMHKAVCVANVYFFSHLLGVSVDQSHLAEYLEAWTKNDYFSTDGEYSEWLLHQMLPQ